MRLFLLLLIFCLTLVSLSYAELKVTPSISIREEYDDNIFLSSDDEEGDFITSIYPLINLSYTTNFMTLSLDYGMNFRFYMHNSDLNETDLADTQRAKLDSTLSLYREILFIKVFDEYARIPIDVRRQTAIDNPFVNMTDINRFRINPYLELPLSSTLKLRTGYSYENIWYRDEAGDSAQIHLITTGFLKELSPKLSASLFYNFLIYEPKITEEYKRHDIVLGLNYQVSQKLSLNGSIGNSWLNYQKGEDFISPTWNINANYQLTDRVAVGAAYSQNFFDSVDVGAFEREAVSAYVTREGNIPVTLTVFADKDDYTIENREDKATGVTFSAEIPITPRIKARPILNYTYYKFLPQQEKAKRYGAGLYFDYETRITTLSFGYIHNLGNSTINENEYRNNRFWIQAKFTL